MTEQIGVTKSTANTVRLVDIQSVGSLEMVVVKYVRAIMGDVKVFTQ